MRIRKISLSCLKKKGKHTFSHKIKPFTFYRVDRIHNKNLHEIKRKDGRYKLRTLQSTEKQSLKMNEWSKNILDFKKSTDEKDRIHRNHKMLVKLVQI